MSNINQQNRISQRDIIPRAVKSRFLDSQIIIPDKNGVNRISLDADKGELKISQAGIDVTKATNNELILSNDIHLMKDNTGINRIVFDAINGYFKLSQPTFDVLTATDDQLIWSSEFNSFKIVQKGTAVVTVDATPYLWGKSITHSLNAFPMVVASVHDPQMADVGEYKRVPVPSSQSILPESPPDIGIIRNYKYYYVDSNTIGFVVEDGRNAPTLQGDVTFYYSLLVEIAQV